MCLWGYDPAHGQEAAPGPGDAGTAVVDTVAAESSVVVEAALAETGAFDVACLPVLALVVEQLAAFDALVVGFVSRGTRIDWVEALQRWN